MPQAKPTPKPKTAAPLLLFIQWLLFTSFAVWSGLMLGSWITPRLAATLAGNEDSFFPYLVLLSLGLTLGVVQAVLLGKLLPESGRWLRYTLAGFLGAMVVIGLSSLLQLSLPGLVDDLLLMALLGAAVGIGQWLLLRRHFASAWMWIAATALGGLFFLLLVTSPAADPNEFVVRGTLYGLISAIPSGLALLWLSRRPVK